MRKYFINFIFSCENLYLWYNYMKCLTDYLKAYLWHIWKIIVLSKVLAKWDFKKICFLHFVNAVSFFIRWLLERKKGLPNLFYEIKHQIADIKLGVIWLVENYIKQVHSQLLWCEPAYLSEWEIVTAYYSSITRYFEIWQFLLLFLYFDYLIHLSDNYIIMYKLLLLEQCCNLQEPVRMGLICMQNSYDYACNS